MHARQVIHLLNYVIPPDFPFLVFEASSQDVGAAAGFLVLFFLNSVILNLPNTETL